MALILLFDVAVYLATTCRVLYDLWRNLAFFGAAHEASPAPCGTG
jgi:hypothetical protein